MKSNLYKLSTTALVIAIAVVSAYAISGTASAAEVTGTESAFESTSSPVPVTTANTSPLPTKKGPALIRPKIKALEDRSEANGTARNTMLQKRQEIRSEASTTIKQIREEERGEIKATRASTTEMFKRSADMRKDIKAKMEAKTFAIRKDALVKELNLSLTNIANISTRISTRITKVEGEGKVVTDAKTLLVTANEKLAKAKVDVAAFQALNLTASSTVEVDLVKPRVAGDAAIKSVKEARDAFQKVVVALAHDLGEKLPTATVSPSPAVVN